MSTGMQPLAGPYARRAAHPRGAVGAAPPGVQAAPADTLHTPAFRWVLAIFVAMSFARVHETIPGLGIIRPSLLIMGLVFLTATPVVVRGWHVLRGGAGKALMVMLIMAVLSIPTSYWPRASVNYLYISYAPTLLMFVVVAVAFQNRATMRMCLIAAAVGAIWASAAGIMGFTGYYSQGRYAFGGTYDPNETAALFIITIPILLYLIEEKGRPRLLAIVGLPILLVGIMRTGSRGGILALALLLPYLVFMAPPRRRSLYILAAVLGIGAYGTFASGELRSRMVAIFDETDYNFTAREGRKETWKRGIGYMLSNPVLGVGFNGFGYAEGASKINEGYGIKFSAAHNSFIQVGAELGFIGFGAFLVLLWAPYIACYRLYRAARKYAARGDPMAIREAAVMTCATAMIVAAAASGFFLSLAYSSLMMFSIGTGIGVAAGSPLARALMPARGVAPGAAPGAARGAMRSSPQPRRA